MRELRFRAWDKKLNKMSYSFNLGDGCCFPGLFVYKVHKNKKRFILMQSTGLKDKHNIDIYDQDIIQTKSGANGYFIWIVQWDNRGGWVTKSIGYKYADGSYIKDGHIYHLAWYLDNSSGDNEVIGNSYESPELMKGVE